MVMVMPPASPPAWPLPETQPETQPLSQESYSDLPETQPQPPRSQECQESSDSDSADTETQILGRAVDRPKLRWPIGSLTKPVAVPATLPAGQLVTASLLGKRQRNDHEGDAQHAQLDEGDAPVAEGLGKKTMVGNDSQESKESKESMTSMHPEWDPLKNWSQIAQQTLRLQNSNLAQECC